MANVGGIDSPNGSTGRMYSRGFVKLPTNTQGCGSYIAKNLNKKSEVNHGNLAGSIFTVPKTEIS